MSNPKNKSPKKSNKNYSTNGVSDYKYNPKVENPNPKAVTDKAPSAGNIRGV